MPTFYQWTKTCSPTRAQCWLKKVSLLVPPERLAIVTPASGRRLRLQAYLDREHEAMALAQSMGGAVSKVNEADWLPAPTTTPGKPLRFGPRLLITGRPEELPILREQYPGKHVLGIPAAMAFGTGEHATTAMCLRFLGEVGRLHGIGVPWSLLDLGCGSGVLALAARIFGAEKVEGWDHDPHAVRTARENATLNAVSRVRIRRVDLLKDDWPADASLPWPVVTANLFSELLISTLPKIVDRLPVGGLLIASGILASQAAAVEVNFEASGLRVVTKRRRGRWVAYLAERMRKVAQRKGKRL